MSLRVLEWIRHRDGIWNLPASQLRRRAVAAYGKWQKLTPGQAGSVFAKR